MKLSPMQLYLKDLCVRFGRGHIPRSLRRSATALERRGIITVDRSYTRWVLALR